MDKILEKSLEKSLKSFIESKEAQDAVEKIADNKEYVIKFKITNESTDRDGEKIIGSGINWWPFDKNPVILIDHNYAVSSIAWKAINREVEWKDTYLIVQLAKGVEAGELVKTLHSQGMIKGVSIWFIPLERDRNDKSIITKSEALEASFVAIWSNREALIEDQKLYQKCLDLGFIKEINTEKTGPEGLNVWDIITYRTIDKWTNEDGKEIEHIYPSESELPRMGKIIQKLESWEEVLTWGSEANIGTKENPLITIHDHVRSIEGPKTMTNYVRMVQFDEVKIERIVSDEELEKWFKEYSNETEEKVPMYIQDMQKEMGDISENLKTLANDKAEEKNLSKVRELGKELQKSLSALNAEAKAQN